MGRKKVELKQEEIFEEYTANPKLTAAEYWEWRNAISELWLAESRMKEAEAELKFLKKDAELQQARMQLFYQSTVRAKKSNFDDSRNAYQLLKKRLEERLKVSLNNKLIDDVTFEVKDAVEDTVGVNETDSKQQAANA